MILCAEGNYSVGSPLPKNIKDDDSWDQEEMGQVHGRNLLED